MRTPQLLSGAIGLVIISISGCNRAETDRQARDAAAEVRTAAAQAGERLTDGWLTTKVQAQYFADEDIKARYIDVSTRDAVVTLEGYVESQAAREEAVHIARNTDGVRSVDDRLLIGVSPEKETFETATDAPRGAVATGGSADADAARAGDAQPPAPLDDEQITRMVQARFFLDPAIKVRTIDVTTENGVVTLRGKVANETERAQALLVARHTNGVGRVEDMLAIEGVK